MTNGSIAGVEWNVKVAGVANSRIPSIFDHMVRNSSTIKSNYQPGCISSFQMVVSLIIRPYR